MNAPLPLNVFQRLNMARRKFHSLKLQKSGHNKFAGYKYFELGDFLIPALTIFDELGLCATVTFKETAMMVIRCVDKPEDFVIIESPFGSAALKGCHEVQNIGAVETYQRRYLWVAALEIVEHDALDSSKPIEEEKENLSTSAPITPANSIWEEISDEEKTFLIEIGKQAISLYNETGSIQEVAKFIDGQRLDPTEKAALTYALNGAKTKEGKNLHTAWAKYTRDNPTISLAEVA